MKIGPIGLIGPGNDKPCGINDYVQDLWAEFKKQTEAEFFTYQEALNSPLVSKCSYLFLHYESSLMPYQNYLEKLGKQLSNKLIVIPHEVYDEDPFAFPYSKLEANNRVSLWLKQLNYKLKHKNYIHEKEIQKKSYHASRVIPLSQVNFEILKKVGCENLERIIPLAYHPHFSENFLSEKSMGYRLGIFGFLNPANDYSQVFKALQNLEDEISLIIMGGDKQEGEPLQKELINLAKEMKLSKRIKFCGYLTGDALKEEMSRCTSFVCPFKFRSNSASLLKLIPWNKPLFVNKIPLTEELQTLGAPIHLFQSTDQLQDLIKRDLNDKLSILPNQYIYDFETVVKMYLKRIA